MFCFNSFSYEWYLLAPFLVLAECSVQDFRYRSKIPSWFTAQSRWGVNLDPSPGTYRGCRSCGRSWGQRWSRSTRSMLSVAQSNVGWLAKAKSQITHGNCKACLNFHITNCLGHTPWKGPWTALRWLCSSGGGWCVRGMPHCSYLHPQEAAAPSLLH